MKIIGIANVISRRIAKGLSLWNPKSDRKLDQVVDPESGILFELFENEDGSHTVWQTDPDGISTLWDCSDSPAVTRNMTLSAFRVCCI